ncbi:MAG TPA: pitrilysin family protein [Candidatus Binatia bacterium]|jgi:zinc protease
MRRQKIIFEIVLALVCFPISTAFATTPVREVMLNNGLKVLLLEDHKSPTVAFQVWYRVGSRNEIDGKSGLSHFLEHMMFKGTPSIKPEEYARIIAKNGGRSNAFTTSDVTVYFATMSRDKIGIEIDMEADRMANALLGDTYFEAEKKVIQEERRLRTDDNPTAALDEVTSAVAFTVHPYRRPVIGWMDDIQNLTRQDLVDHYKLYYAPENAFVVIAGDFSTEEILPRIRKAFEKIPRRPEPPKMRAQEPPQKGERRVFFKKQAELPFVLMFYHAPNLKSPDSFALDVLSVVLASGRSSRLYRDLVYEKRLARNIDAGYSSVSIDPGGFSVTAQVMPGRTPDEVEKEIDTLLEQIKSDPITERELQKAKNQIESSFIFAQDSIFGQATKIGYYEAAGGWRQMDQYIPGIRQVTREDIRRVAAHYLDRDHRTVGVLIPTKENVQ